MRLLDRYLDRHHFEGYERRQSAGEDGSETAIYVYVGDHYIFPGEKKRHLARKVLYALMFVLAIVLQAFAGMQRIPVNYALYVNVFQALALISELPLAVYLYHYISAPYRMEVYYYIRSHRRFPSLCLLSGVLLCAAVVSMIIRIIIAADARTLICIICAAAYALAATLLIAIRFIERSIAYTIEPSEYK